MAKNKDKKILWWMGICACILIAIVVTLAIRSYAGIVPTWKVLLPFALGFIAIACSGTILLIVLKFAGKKPDS
jgi:formate/nitrite transporter FocA (FNT family)